MPSSTSSSDLPTLTRIVPDQPWGRLASIVLLAVVIFSASWEVFWRAHWLEANDYNDAPVLWRWARAHAVNDATVLVGSSRIFEDVDVDTWQRGSGSRPVQLAIPGQNPTPVLHDLATDAGFRGLVVMEVTPYLFFMQPTDATLRMMREARGAGPGARVDETLDVALERHVASLDEYSRLSNLWKRIPLPIRIGQFPVRDVPKGNTMRADRSAAMWRRLVEDSSYRDHYRWLWLTYAGSGGAVPGAEEAVSRVSRAVARDVDAIRSRGGDVVFVRFPSSNPLNSLEERSMGRSVAWTPLLRITRARGIHFADYPQLRKPSPPDMSHLSSSEAKAFTAALLPLVQTAVKADLATRR